MRFGDELDQVFVPFLIFYQKHYVIFFIVNARPFLMHPFKGQIKFGADYRFDAHGCRFFVKLHGSVQNSVVG